MDAKTDALETLRELNRAHDGPTQEDIAEGNLRELAPLLARLKTQFDQLDRQRKDSKSAALEAWATEMSDLIDRCQELTVDLAEADERARAHIIALAEAGRHGAICDGMYTIKRSLKLDREAEAAVKEYLVRHSVRGGTEINGKAFMMRFLTVDWTALEKALKPFAKQAGRIADDTFADFPAEFVEEVQTQINWSKLPAE